MAEDSNGAAEFKTPLFSASVKGKDVQIRDIVGLMVLLVTSVTAYAVFDHQVMTLGEAKQLRSEFTSAIKEMVNVNKDIAQGQRELNCLMALTPDQREGRADLCKRISR